ncbi:BolA/IbaG family iron-sulfur metabolism protein [Enterobacteriaceae endosymbiont of Donacia semicuprea]|uniref:BolA/IbaG family iron-sulfur metabolism protein n=1 Tax=Enterobacteriaceae endosymbiont of Donacia semicuprea TaxID=2675783 RepID=UPI00144940EE|nr:BolA family protein [Enterobacteriaceae endosymbiont of Donacia semicuprea]QJC32882.1 BolA/IbaG family iron-sulfur metabolism protein [Enterobacteriaceae endosymbiont of Donacia semicuprea]
MIIKKIKNKIKSKLEPIYLKINNNSHNHNNHISNLITHLEIIIVSNFFIKKKLISRHRLIYHIIGDILKDIHSLSLYTYTSVEWEKIKIHKI